MPLTGFIKSKTTNSDIGLLICKMMGSNQRAFQFPGFLVQSGSVRGDSSERFYFGDKED